MWKELKTSVASLDIHAGAAGFNDLVVTARRSQKRLGKGKSKGKSKSMTKSRRKCKKLKKKDDSDSEFDTA